ncbi:MAG: radical SAM protein [Sterolibacterium sp.]
MTIILTTLNARYSHASLGLRYLHANMGELRDRTQILEFVLGLQTSAIVERLLALQPRIIGFGVYIWNVTETARVVAMLKRVAPEIKIVLGGPEVSYESAEQAIVQQADYVITGWGEIGLPVLCRNILHGASPLEKIHVGEQAALDDLALPYRLYNENDIAHRNIYVEASRGCPFKCEFCLSALDKTALPFDTDRFLDEMEALYARGARQFKFVDRTFNLNPNSSARILQFFLDKLTDSPDGSIFVHFEVVPDYLPDELKLSIARFPRGTLQLEVGVQTLNPEVQSLIGRKQNNEKALSNIRWLRENSQAHIHADLIVGLPGEDLSSFARGFDRLYALKPQEIQIGILKRLRGTPIIRHSETFRLVFDPSPPYRILATDRIDFSNMQRLVRFARYWELIANSGRFALSLPVLLGNAPFENFMACSEWLHGKTQATSRIAFDRLVGLLAQWLEFGGLSKEAATALVSVECAGKPRQFKQSSETLVKPEMSLPRRQARHLG